MKLLLSVLICVTLLSTITTAKRKPKSNLISAKPSSITKPKPSSITKPKPSGSAYAKFDSLLVSNLDCIGCLVRAECRQCISPCSSGIPQMCFDCMVEYGCPCIKQCGFPKTSDEIEKMGLGYDPVNIQNPLLFTLSGQVEYKGLFCRTDSWSTGPHGEWTGPKRFYCLVSKITATTQNGQVCTPFVSNAGTSDCNFGLVPNAGGSGCVVFKEPNP